MTTTSDASQSPLLTLQERIVELNAALRLDANQYNMDEFYKKLIHEVMNWQDVLPCLGTVFANLTQNFFFLMKVIGEVCGEDQSCNITANTVVLTIDFFATGTNNMFQRFWTSTMFAWIRRLPEPTRSFIEALHADIKIKQKKDEKLNTLLVLINDEMFDAVTENKNTFFLWLFRLFSTTPTLMQALQLLSMFYKVQIQIQIHLNKHSLVDEENQKHDHKKNIAYFNYAPTQYTLYKLFQDASILNLYCLIFLRIIPCAMMCFQTIGMLSETVPEKKLNLPLANFLFIFGGLFGFGKSIVNAAMRLDPAIETLHDMFTYKYWHSAAIFLLYDIIGKFFYGLMALLQCSPSRALSFLLPALIRLCGVFLGISITLFYLDVGLYTKQGIQFTLSTLISDFGGDSKPAVAYYENWRVIMDLLCAIAILSYNGVLTQMPESIKKCNQLANKADHYFNPSDLAVDNLFASASQKEVIRKMPCLIHFANVLDICVFIVSAWTAIQDLLNLASGKKSHYSHLRTVALFLSGANYALISGVGAGISNLIFTYAAAADNQMPAWSYFGQRLGLFAVSPITSNNNSNSDFTASVTDNSGSPRSLTNTGSPDSTKTLLRR